MADDWTHTPDTVYYETHIPCGQAIYFDDVRAHKCSGRKRVLFDNNGICIECGAAVGYNNRQQHGNFHTNYIHRAEVKDGTAVSAVKWCDMGNHAFKASEPGAQSIRVTQGSEEVMMDMCGEHAFPTTATPTPESTMRAVETSYEREQQSALPGMQQIYNERMKQRLATPMNDDTV